MFNIRKYSYVILWVTLILVVGTVWVFGKEDTSSHIKEKTAVTQDVSQGDNTESEQQDTSTTEGRKEVPREQTGGDVSSNSEVSLDMPIDTETGEMVGIWIPFMSLVTQEKTEEAFKKNFEKIVQDSKEKGINALFVHVRPYGDAFYPSESFPWSHLLTGEQGKDPGYDPLAFMVDYSHANDMEFHAWLNPLRLKTNETPQNLSADNPYTMLKNDYPFYFMEHEGAIYLNPAYQYIRTLIADGAAEIAKNYDVDGIHFDDYFYPSEEGGFDSVAYEGYIKTVEEPLSLLEWRRANVSAMVSEVYMAVKQVKSEVVFGISPAGNIENNLKIGANIQEWCATPGYIDYICPQLYYSYDNAALGYKQALDRWVSLEKHDGLKLHIGLALYKAGSDADEGTWLSSNDIIQKQIEDARSADCDGIILYSYDFLNKEETRQEVENAVAVLQ